MKNLILVLLALTFSQTSFAGRVDVVPDAPAVHGVNEEMTISYSAESQTWGYKDNIGYSGSYAQGTLYVHLVPVTEKAFDVMAQLDQDSAYICLVKKSTPAPIRANSEIIFVISIDCD